MQAHERKALSQARLEHAVECLSAARNYLKQGIIRVQRTVGLTVIRK